MSEEKQNLQRQADRSRPGGGHSVLSYLAVMFAAAFVLLLLSFFMQHRANQVAMENLQATSTSAVQSIQNLNEERDQLKEEVARQDTEIAALEAEVARLEQALDAAQGDMESEHAAAQKAQEQETALYRLHVIRTLYIQRRYQDARDYINLYGEELERVLEEFSTSALDDEGREQYSPIDAYQDIKGWLF